MAKADSFIFAVSNNGLFKSDNGGASWQFLFKDIYNSTASSIYFKNGQLFVGASNGRIFRSSDLGTNWLQVKSTEIAESIFTIQGGDSFLVAASRNSLFKSTNGGNSWEKIILSSSINDFKTVSIFKHKILIIASKNLFFSPNSGETWTKLPTNFDAITFPTSCLINDSTFMAVNTNGSFMISNDLGNVWKEYNSNLPSGNFPTCLAQTDSILFLGSGRAGVFLSKDNGKNWSVKNEDLEIFHINTLLYTDNNLYIGGSGVWRRELEDMFLSVKKNSNSKQKVLVFPNPANSKVTIQFEPINAKPFFVSITDIYGHQLVSNLFGLNGKLEVNLSGFAKGIYLLLVKNEEGNLVEKLYIND